MDGFDEWIVGWIVGCRIDRSADGSINVEIKI